MSLEILGNVNKNLSVDYKGVAEVQIKAVKVVI